MNSKISVFVVCVEAIIYLLLYILHDCTFNPFLIKQNDSYTLCALLQLCDILIQAEGLLVNRIVSNIKIKFVLLKTSRDEVSDSIIQLQVPSSR